MEIKTLVEVTMLVVGTIVFYVTVDAFVLPVVFSKLFEKLFEKI